MYFLLSVKQCLHQSQLIRSRTRECHICEVQEDALHRCRYDGVKEWSFLCGKCLTEIKAEHEKTYQYGGTWKRKKR